MPPTWGVHSGKACVACLLSWAETGPFGKQPATRCTNLGLVLSKSKTLDLNYVAAVVMLLDCVQEVSKQARDAGKTNVAFLANFLLQDTDACIDILLASDRIPEAAFFARTYRPSRVPELVKLWQGEMRTVNTKAAESLASPEEYVNLFPDWESALHIEGLQVAKASKAIPAVEYPEMEGEVKRGLLATSSSDPAHAVRCWAGSLVRLSSLSFYYH